MKSPFECRVYAEKCRALANGFGEERRREVLRMADIWEGLARDRQGRQHDSTFRSDRRKLERRIGWGLDPERLWAAGLRTNFDEVAKEPLPTRFRNLLKQLDAVESRGRA